MIEGKGEIVRIITGFSDLDGIVWRREDGIVFTDSRNHQITRWVPGSKTDPFTRDDSGGPAGLALDTQSRLIIVEHQARRVIRADKDEMTTLIDHVDGGPLWGPTDITVAPGGDLFITDFGSAGGRVVRLSTAGEPSVAVSDVVRPSGVAVSPSGTTLYVSDAARAELRAYPIDHRAVGAGRRLASIQPWKSGVSGVPDGLLVDRAGHIFLAGPGGMWVLDENGGRLGVIAMPERPASCAFGDGDGRTLYCAAETSVYKVRMKARP
jgi:gluconolactonase